MQKLFPLAKNETGNRYGRLVVQEVSGRKYGQIEWLCLCDCGEFKRVLGENLRKGHTRSCGCLNKEMIRERSLKHGFASSFGFRHPLYASWNAMRQRCYNPNDDSFRNYGGRGIRVFQEWIDDGAAFVRWIEENLGPRPEEFSLDRIDNDGNYEPGNLRWASRSTQNKNRRAQFPLSKEQERVLGLLTKHNLCSYRKLQRILKKSGAI